MGPVYRGCGPWAVGTEQGRNTEVTEFHLEAVILLTVSHCSSPVEVIFPCLKKGTTGRRQKRREPVRNGEER
jgi:hypothetical protein